MLLHFSLSFSKKAELFELIAITYSSSAVSCVIGLRYLTVMLLPVTVSDIELIIEGCTVVNSLEDAMTAATKADNSKNEIFITGGAHLYNKFLEEADTLYITQIDAELEGDTFFPDYTKYNWQEKQRIEHTADDKNPYPLTFLKLERLKSESLKTEYLKT